MDRENCIEICNQLLRGELSAIETYDQAIARFKHNHNAIKLERIRNEHEDSAKKLRENVIRMGGEPDGEPGVWGTFSKLVEGSARLFGERAALRALIEGEKIGAREYQEALNDEDVLSGCKTLIRAELLPKQERHISDLTHISSELMAE